MSQPILRTITVIATAALCGCTALGARTDLPKEQKSDSLFETVSALDAETFESFNNCSSMEQLQKHAGYFAVDVEFYHDTGGVTWSRQDMIANTEKHICGKVSRELVSGSLKVYPIKDYGAIAQGVHRFCQVSTGDCEGLADFAIVWRNQDGEWQITRVLSYGHRPNR